MPQSVRYRTGNSLPAVPAIETEIMVIDEALTLWFPARASEIGEEH
jgi:hypothetical protein